MLYDAYNMMIFVFTTQDLIKDLKSELSGNIEECILALFMPLEYYDAHQIHKAIKVYLFVFYNWHNFLILTGTLL